MSRMTAYVSPTALACEAALGAPALTGFSALAGLHADGWGSSWHDPATGALHRTVETRPASPEHLRASTAAPSAARLLYLRFASAGAPVAPANAQPFLHAGMAFQHNGLITPRSRALEMLDERERRSLTGSTDSEVYFALLRRRLVDRTEPARALDTAAGAVSDLRAAFPDACLNALALLGGHLLVISSAGTAPPPLASFAARGFDPEHLPPDHDAHYNELRTTVTSTGVRVVATTGFDQSGWETLAPDSVSLFSGERALRILL